MKIEITPLVLTFNEEPNISRALSALPWAKDIVIVDSGSNDRTIELIQCNHPNIRVFKRAFDSFAAQCNFGLTQIATEWVLSLDADYVLTPEFNAEIQLLNPPDDTSGYSAEFRYCINGRPLRSNVYPARTVLYRKGRAKYRNEGHGHRVIVDGKVEMLKGKIDHDDRKPFSRWLEAQRKYAKLEAVYLREQSWRQLSWPDRLRRMIFPAAPAMFLYTLLRRGLVFDGWPGWVYVYERTLAELFLSLQLLLTWNRSK